jgi:hypothetical protein
MLSFWRRACWRSRSRWSGREAVQLEFHAPREEPRQHQVKVVAAQLLDAYGVEDRELGAVDAHQRRVEGAAAEVRSPRP